MRDKENKVRFCKAINTSIQTMDNWYTKYKVGDSIYQTIILYIHVKWSEDDMAKVLHRETNA